MKQSVTGFGGFFFRANDPTALAHWYTEHLGIAPVPNDYDTQPWSQEAGPTAFAPFPADTDYFGNARKNWMLNFRVRNLNAIVAQLRKANIPVKIDPEVYPNGRFARLRDPEGNPIELWEPKRSSKSQASSSRKHSSTKSKRPGRSAQRRKRRK
jgi:glyoxylase I family protein